MRTFYPGFTHDLAPSMLKKGARMDGKMLFSWITGLSFAGVRFTVLGEQLKLDAPTGVLTAEIVAKITENKVEIIANRVRASIAREHLGELRGELERKGVVIEWAREDSEYKEAEENIENHVVDYISGDGSIDEITKAFWGWVSLAAERAPAIETRVL